MLAVPRITCPSRYYVIAFLFCAWLTMSEQSHAQHDSGDSHLLPVGGKRQPVHGMNLAWLNGQYDHDFGFNALHPDWGCGFSERDLDRYFADMARMRVNVCRIWVFESLEGLLFDDNGFVKGLDPTLVKNFDTTVGLARKHKIHLYLALANHFGPSCDKGGFKNIISNRSATKRYVDNAVVPFVKRFKGDDTIFAIDIMNEPEGEIAGRHGNWKKEGNTMETMGRFLDASVTGIRRADRNRLVSCGSGWHSYENIQAGRYKPLNLDFYDFHEYNDTGHLPPISELKVDKPVLVGECNQDNQREEIDDEVQLRAIKGFLENAKKHRYAGIVVWYYDFPNQRAADSRFLSILKTGGSAEWRPAAKFFSEFIW